MNQIQPYGDVHAPPHVPSTGPPPAMGHYQPYQSQALPPAYSSTPAYNTSYAYPSAPQHQQPGAYPASSSMSSSLMSMTLPAMTSNAPGATPMGEHPYNRAERPYDQTGQVAPPGMKPRVTATLWEDEGSLCFQVEARGICVARREDNHMINGTKLLNVAGMTRGRRDGILKSEKTRHVVKIGPMHLKGVWIPFDRALQFANKEKITELLYPLFVHDIAALLYPPPGPRPPLNTGTMPTPRRETRYLPQGTQAPTPGMHHHHSMSVGGTPQPTVPHAGRPELNRAHTFPTPPTSASSVMGMSTQGSAYEGSWSGMQASGQPLSIDTGLSNARSVPTTPATTPPANVISSMQPYQTSQAYETPRQSYATAPGQQDIKHDSGYASGEPVHHTNASHDDHASADHDAHYGAHAQYDATRGTYTYPSAAGATAQQQPLHSGDHSHLSPELTHHTQSPSHANGADRSAQRAAPVQPQWTTPNYGAPTGAPSHRPAQQTTSTLYNVVSDPRSNGATGPDPYPSSGYGAAHANTGAGAPYGAPNGVVGNGGGLKRMRDDEDEYKHEYKHEDVDGGDLKRQRTIREDSVGGAVGGGSPYKSTVPRARPMAQPRR